MANRSDNRVAPISETKSDPTNEDDDQVSIQTISIEEGKSHIFLYTLILFKIKTQISFIRT